LTQLDNYDPLAHTHTHTHTHTQRERNKQNKQYGNTYTNHKSNYPTTQTRMSSEMCVLFEKLTLELRAFGSGNFVQRNSR